MLNLNDRSRICLNKNFNSLVIENGGCLRMFPLMRAMLRILLIRQESFGLAKEVVKPF
jgi:hypothetical protein